MTSLRKRIALITARADDGEQRSIIYGIADECRANGVGLAVFSNLYNYWTDDPLLSYENAVYDYFEPSQFSGVIITYEAFRDMKLLEGVIRKIRRAKLPAAVIGGRLRGFESVFSDDAADLEFMAEHLVREHGCSRIDILTGPQGNTAAEERAEGAVRGLRRMGIAFSDSQLHYGSFWTDSGEALAERYLSGELPMPEAVICTNDHMAFGLCDKLSGAGVDIPGTVAVTGYDHTGGRIYHMPLLTTMVRDRYGTGAAAVRAVLGHIYDARHSSPPQLVKGLTCGCAADGVKLCNEMQAERISGYHVLSSSSPQLLNSLTLCRTLSEYMTVIQGSFDMLYGAESLTVCIDKKWSGGSYSGEELLCTRITPGGPLQGARLLESSSFLETLLEDESASVVYISPLVFQKRLFGLALLGYREAGVYYFAYRDFCKNIANALELLRMKSDISYLEQCISESKLYDSLTHFYNPEEFSRILESLGNEQLYCSVIRLSAADAFDFENGETLRLQLIADIARDIRLCCTGRELLCRADENTFLIARRGSSEVFHKGLVMIAQRALLTSYSGPDAAIEGRSARLDSRGLSAIDGLFEGAQPPARSAPVPHSSELMELRAEVYSSPASAPATEEACRRLLVGPARLRTLYRSCFGRSYTDDCISAKLMQACYLLLTTSMSIFAIAGSCGYSDEKFFSRQFADRMGCPPKSFRTLFRGEQQIKQQSDI